MELLVPQDSAFSVQVLGVFRLHGLVLGLLRVMFTSLLDLCQASRSCHEVLDELYPKVLLSTLNSCINIKLQNRHARTNLLYQWIRYKIHSNTEGKLMARLMEIRCQQCHGDDERRRGDQGCEVALRHQALGELQVREKVVERESGDIKAPPPRHPC
jgi:hypothetical protein